MHVVNTFRTSNGPPKFCIELEADWLIVLDEARTKSPGMELKASGYGLLTIHNCALTGSQLRGGGGGGGSWGPEPCFLAKGALFVKKLN